MKRKVYSLLDLLADLGGMSEALSLVIGPFVYSVASRSFYFDLVTRHMKVKKRASFEGLMPKDPISRRTTE